MTITKLFTVATAVIALTLSLNFSANAKLITQSFELELEDSSTTIELAALTQNADLLFDTKFIWKDDSIEHFSIFGLTLPGETDSQDFIFRGADLLTVFNSFTASAFVNSVSGAGAANGFDKIRFEMNLGALSPMLEGVTEIAILNNNLGFKGAFSILAQRGTVRGQGQFSGSAGPVTISAPASTILIFLSVCGLLLVREKPAEWSVSPS